MSWLSDISGGSAQDAATAQTGDLQAGMVGAQNYLNLNPGIIQSLGGQALQPYQTNYNNSQQGVGALGNLLGLNGAAGSQSALTSLETTPGYQFTKGQGEGAINATAAANGTTNSGNALTALSNYDSGLAQNTYQSAVSNLQPYLGAANSAAGGMAGVLGGETSALTGNNNTLASLYQSTLAAQGNAKASGDLAQGAAEGGVLGGALSLGSSALGGLGGLGGIGATLGGGLSGLFGGGSSMMSDASLGGDIMGGGLFG